MSKANPGGMETDELAKWRPYVPVAAPPSYPTNHATPANYMDGELVNWVEDAYYGQPMIMELCTRLLAQEKDAEIESLTESNEKMDDEISSLKQEIEDLKEKIEKSETKLDEGDDKIRVLKKAIKTFNTVVDSW